MKINYTNFNGNWDQNCPHCGKRQTEHQVNLGELEGVRYIHRLPCPEEQHLIRKKAVAQGIATRTILLAIDICKYIWDLIPFKAELKLLWKSIKHIYISIRALICLNRKNKTIHANNEATKVNKIPKLGKLPAYIFFADSNTEVVKMLQDWDEDEPNNFQGVDYRSIKKNNLWVTVSANGEITHLGIIRKGPAMSGGNRLIYIKKFVEVGGVYLRDILQIISSSPVFSSFNRTFNEISTNKWVSENAARAFFESMIIAKSDTEDKIRGIVDFDNTINISISGNGSIIASHQNDAIAISLKIFGVDADQVIKWLPKSDDECKDLTSILPLIESRVRGEDERIINDVINEFGVNTNFDTDGLIFHANQKNLILLHANKNKLEHTTGVDLIYYNKKVNSYCLLQYKTMAIDASGNEKFNLHDSQLTTEIKRMESIEQTISRFDYLAGGSDFRLNKNPFYVKVTNRRGFSPRSEPTSGRIFPLEQIKLFRQDMLNKHIHWEDERRHIDNSTFKSLFEKGLIGSNENSSTLISSIIAAVLDQNKSLILAVETS